MPCNNWLSWSDVEFRNRALAEEALQETFPGAAFAQWFEAADSELLARKANRGESRERAVVS